MCGDGTEKKKQKLFSGQPFTSPNLALLTPPTVTITMSRKWHAHNNFTEWLMNANGKFYNNNEITFVDRMLMI